MPMRSLRLRLLLPLALAAMTSVSALAERTLPQVLHDPALSQSPIWISDDLLEGDPSSISSEYWEDLLGWNSALLHAAEHAGCINKPLHLTEDPVTGRQDTKLSVHRDLRTSFGDATWVGLVEVLDAQAGFQGVFPGTLLQVRFTSLVKGQIPTFDRYLFYPAGRVTLKGKEICVTAEELPPLPAIGDKLMIFSLEGQGRANFLWDWDRLSVISFDSSSSVEKARFPAWFSEAKGGSSKEIAARLLSRGY